MSEDLLKLLKEYLSDDVVANLAKLIGEPVSNVQDALKIALPSLLAGLIYKSADDQTNEGLFSLIRDDHDGSILSNLGALSKGGDETTKLIATGINTLDSILGNKKTRFTNIVAFRGNFTSKASTPLLGFITPVVIGLLSKKLKFANIQTPNEFAEFITNQGQFIDQLVPKGMVTLFSTDEPFENTTTAQTGDAAMAVTAESTVSANEPVTTPSNGGVSEPIAGFGEQVEPLANEALASDEPLANSKEVMVETITAAKESVKDTLDAAKETLETVSHTTSELGATVLKEGKEFAQSAANKFEEGAGEGSKLLPWLLGLAAIALAWGLLKSCSAPTEDSLTENTTSSTATQATAPGTTVPQTSVGPATTTPPAAMLGGSLEKTLPTGYVIKGSAQGFISKLMGFIENSDPVSKDLWFSMDGITFETGKSTITSESEAQLNDISEILKAYPKVKIKIGGYTDNIGFAKANLTLSDSRANAVKAALVAKGIEAQRIEAEGYGSEHPVASNDTEDGRQKNRRIDVRVTEK